MSKLEREGTGILDTTKLLANALGEHLSLTYRRAFGSREPRYAEVIDEAARLFAARGDTMFSFPRNVDSVAFYTDRSDIQSCRTRVSQELVEALIQRDRSVVLFTHKHSLDTFKQVLPPHLKVVEATAVKHKGTGADFLDKLVGDGPWGLCHVAVIERVK